MIIPRLSSTDKNKFPAIETALAEPQGLLAIGGDLHPTRLLNAYRQGIFPWFEEGQEILWWCPNPRMVLIPSEIKINRSFKKVINNRGFTVTIDNEFDHVINACAAINKNRQNTWITSSMIKAYQQLHQLGHAHSFETWLDGQIVGGLYGLSLGRIFFGESMFSLVSDASKIALYCLSSLAKEWQIPMIDCQVKNHHLLSLGAKEIPISSFQKQLKLSVFKNGPQWQSLIDKRIIPKYRYKPKKII